MTGSVIVDIQGLELTQDDRDLIQHPEVAGLILFSRNFQSIEQLHALTSHIKSLRHPFIIAVDQEGGRVQRFLDGFSPMPPMSHWGEEFSVNPLKAKEELADCLSQTSKKLVHAGINFNLIPVLDVNHGVSEIIGERSFNSDPRVVTEMARKVIEVLHKHRLPAIGKHFPGHGGVAVDSHVDLPVDHRSWTELASCDLVPFKTLVADLDAIMPAHVIYSSIDDSPTTFSSHWLKDVLRDQMGFKGMVVSDDLSMSGAAKLYPDYSYRAKRALSAGCDLILLCNDRENAWKVVTSLETYSKDPLSLKRTKKYIRNLL